MKKSNDRKPDPFAQAAASMPSWEEFLAKARQQDPGASPDAVEKAAKEMRRDWVRQKEREITQLGLAEQRLRSARQPGMHAAIPPKAKPPRRPVLSTLPQGSWRPNVAFSVKPKKRTRLF